MGFGFFLCCAAPVADGLAVQASDVVYMGSRRREQDALAAQPKRDRFVETSGVMVVHAAYDDANDG